LQRGRRRSDAETTVRDGLKNEYIKGGIDAGLELRFIQIIITHRRSSTQHSKSHLNPLFKPNFSQLKSLKMHAHAIIAFFTSILAGKPEQEPFSSARNIDHS
jgi:hypothetical protein